MSHAIVINNYQSQFKGPIKLTKKCKKLSLLDHGGPKMKFTYFHCFS